MRGGGADGHGEAQFKRGQTRGIRIDEPASLGPCQANNLPRRIFKTSNLWIHVHMQTSHDYRVGRCPVLRGLRGYLDHL
jgi:hypothetical protein